MSANVNKIIEELLKEISDEKTAFVTIAKENDDKIQQIERFLKSLKEKEDTDYKVLSPRNVETVYSKQIAEQLDEKRKYEIENHDLYKKIGFYIEKEEKLKKALSEIKQNEDNQEKNERKNFHTEGNTFRTEDKCFDSDKTKTGLSDSDEAFNSSVLFIEMQEAERQRIANDLHDSTVQTLTHLLHKVELTTKFLEQDVTRGKMELLSVSTEIRKAIEEIRNIIFNLRPMVADDLGLPVALESLQSQLQAMTHMQIIFKIEDFLNKEDMRCMILYRIVKECCINSIKHSKGSRIIVTLKKLDEMVALEIKDDGEGFDTEILSKQGNHNYGLVMTKERVQLLHGAMKVVSAKGTGTTILITIPVQHDET